MIINAKNNLLIVAVIFSVVLSGAYYFDIDPFSVDNNKKPSNEELAAFFQKNHLELKKIIPLCKEHPAIRWIGTGKKEVSFYSKFIPAQADYDAAGKMREILDIIEVGTMRCGYRGDLPGNPFSGVSYTMYARGLSVSGESKAIWFDDESAKGQPSIGLQEIIKEGNVKPLPEPGWYIYSSE